MEIQKPVGERVSYNIDVDVAAARISDRLNARHRQTKLLKFEHQKKLIPKQSLDQLLEFAIEKAKIDIMIFEKMQTVKTRSFVANTELYKYLSEYLDGKI